MLNNTGDIQRPDCDKPYRDDFLPINNCKKSIREAENHFKIGIKR